MGTKTPKKKKTPRRDNDNDVRRTWICRGNRSYPHVATTLSCSNMCSCGQYYLGSMRRLMSDAPVDITEEEIIRRRLAGGSSSLKTSTPKTKKTPKKRVKVQYVRTWTCKGTKSVPHARTQVSNVDICGLTKAARDELENFY